MTYEELTALITTERLNMSEQNREHFDIEALDHLGQLQECPGDAQRIAESLRHRIELHKTRNMYHVPPMLFPRNDETESEHMRRERETWGLYEVSNIADSMPESNATGETGQNTGIDTITNKNKQQELF